MKTKRHPTVSYRTAQVLRKTVRKILKYPKEASRFVESARSIAKLTPDQEEKLFYTYNWPYHFFERYNNEDRNRAKVLCDRIEHFILTGE